MNKILKSCLSLLVLMAIAKVLVAQPTQETAGNAVPSTLPVIINQETNSVITMNEAMGEEAMEMQEEAGLNFL